MSRPPLELLEAIAADLATLLDELVFIGGAIVPVLLTDPAAPPPSNTTDVDAIVTVATNYEYTHKLGDRLRSLGFSEDRREDAPICRWRSHSGMTLDMMPTDPAILQFSNLWFPLAFATAIPVQLPSGLTIKIATGPCFLGTKLEAFLSRGNNDYLGSKDIEDFLAVLHGRNEIIGEVRQADAKLVSYLASMAAKLLAHRNFDVSIEGHLPGEDPEVTRSRLREIASLATPT